MMLKYPRTLLAFFLAGLFVFAPAGVLAEEDDPSAEQTKSESSSPSIPKEESLESKFDAAFQQLTSLEEKVRETAELYMQSEGEARERAWAKLSKLEKEIDTELDKIVGYFSEMKQKGQETSAFASKIEKVLTDDQTLLDREIEEVTASLERLSEERKDADVAEKVRIVESAQEAVKSLMVMFNSMLNNAMRKESIGLDSQQDLEKLDAILIKWADELSSRLELLNKQKEVTQDAYTSAAEGDKEGLRLQLDAVKDRHKVLASSLEKTIEVMKKRDLDTGGYRKLLITSTGKITQGILEQGVAVSLFSEWLGQARDWIMENGIAMVFQMIVIILILIGFRFLAALFARLITRGLEKSKLQVSHLFREFAISTTKKIVMLLGILVALSQMGIDVGPMLAGLGVAGFVIGFALKDTLSNFASGMMILVYRPFDVGDAVEVDGVVGKVKAMTLVSTTVLTFDNQQLMIPNNNIWGNTIKNITARKVRRVDMTFGIGYGDDIEKAESILWSIVREHPLVLEDPEPVIKVSALGASSVDFIVRPWSNTADYWDVYWDITRSVKMEFDKAGVSIPFPQSDVHLYRHDLLEGAESKADAKA
ncbi:MAG: mechanosensitive ion channel [Chromatiales bacterium]|jgi:small conductance mechanosensitive channel